MWAPSIRLWRKTTQKAEAKKQLPTRYSPRRPFTCLGVARYHCGQLLEVKAIMGKIVVEFGTPNAKEKLRDWKSTVIKAIEEAIRNITNPNQVSDKKVGIFADGEFSVYFTFEK